MKPQILEDPSLGSDRLLPDELETPILHPESLSYTRAENTLELRSPRASLQVRRSDIEFTTVAPERVLISVTVRNRGLAASSPTIARIESAPLGAFVPWKPLTTLEVPALAPGEQTTLHTEAAPSPRRSRGGARRALSRRLLTALGMKDDRRPSDARLPLTARGMQDDRGSEAANFLRGLRNLVLRGQGIGETALQESSVPGLLAPTPSWFFECGSLQWAGNLNVFVGERAVERHLAQGLRIYAGLTNVADFLVGSGGDEYCFDLAGAVETWKVMLRTMRWDKRIPLRQWIDGAAVEGVFIVLRPPEPCDAGRLEVHVRQRSTNREAIVEFELDPEAAGPGCYVV